MKLKHIALGLAIVTLTAFILLIPIVPFSMTVYTELPGPQPVTSLYCSNPYHHSEVNPTLLYQGYESISRYLTGSGLSAIGVVIYSKCTMQ